MREVQLTGSVAAVSNADGNLQLIPYLVDSAGTLSRGESAAVGAATAIALVHPNPQQADVVTALRNADGNLQLIAWDITADSSTRLQRPSRGVGRPMPVRSRGICRSYGRGSAARIWS